jgi:hypothetical protein
MIYDSPKVLHTTYSSNVDIGVDTLGMVLYVVL